MKVSDLIALTGARNLTEGADTSREIKCGYVCDLLSWVMAHGEEGMAWVTVQTHLNVIAVAALAEMACVVLPEGITMEADVLQKAADEDMIVLTTPLTAYEVCGRLAGQGIPAHG